AALDQRCRKPEQPRAPNGERLSKKIENVAELRAFVEENETEIVQKARALCYGIKGHAEEVAQELYPKLFKVLGEHPNGIDNAWGMTHTVMARLAIDKYRKLKRTRRRIKRLEFPDSIPDPHDARVFEHADIEELCKALEKLPPRLKTIVVGIFLE